MVQVNVQADLGHVLDIDHEHVQLRRVVRLSRSDPEPILDTGIRSGLR
jgi:hypothetical protein